MKTNIHLFFVIILTLSALTGFGQKFVFYLHGKIVENQGPSAIDTVNGYGAYQYFDIIDALKKRNFTVISEVRKPNTNVTAYAQLIAGKIDSLLKKNIDPKNITVIGASKGSIIAMYISTYVKNKDVNYVFMGACDDEIYNKCADIIYYGNILSIYEKSDSLNGGSCIKFKNRSKTTSHYKEIELNTGLKHGFIFRPLNVWLDPATQWANNNYDLASDQKLLITPLTLNYYIFTTYNSYKGTQVPANGLYLVTEAGVVMIDTPWDTTQFQPLLDSIKLKHHKDVVICIATHSHEDRTGGLEYYAQKGIKTYTSKQTDELCKAHGYKRAQYVMSKDSVFKVGTYSFQTYYAGPGHTPDNIVVWFDKEKVLYGGCLIKSSEANDLGNLNDANVKEWPFTIKNLQNKFQQPQFIIPGHNEWHNKKSLEHTLKLIKQHEAKSH
jgi:metallo-beta-lactamase class B